MRPSEAEPVARTKPTPDEEPRKEGLLQIRISEDLRDEAAREADALGVSLSGFVRMAIIQLIAKLKRERES